MTINAIKLLFREKFSWILKVCIIHDKTSCLCQKVIKTHGSIYNLCELTFCGSLLSHEKHEFSTPSR